MLSVTALAGYLYCPRKLYLQYVLKIVDIPREVMIKGSIKHNVYDTINKSEQKIVTSIKDQDIESIKLLYKNHYSTILKDTLKRNRRTLLGIRLPPERVYSEIWPLFNSESLIRAEVIHEFMQKKKLLGQELWENLLPKIKSEYRITSQKLGLRGIVDQLHVYPDGFIPFELKTGRAPNEGVWPGHRIQMGAYLLMLEDIFKVSIPKGFIRYVDSGESRAVVMNQFFKDEILDLIKKVKGLMSSKKIPEYCKNENKCKSCSLNDICHNELLLEQKSKDLNRTLSPD